MINGNIYVIILWMYFEKKLDQLTYDMVEPAFPIGTESHIL
jgi:hypothetical protein